MARLQAEQTDIYTYFSSKKRKFLIPDYQRPYAWGLAECKTLWDDLNSFFFADTDASFDPNDTYFLGPIVTYQNTLRDTEIIDGQQRITTLMLLLRAYYEYTKERAVEPFKTLSKNLADCIWQKDLLDKKTPKQLRLHSEEANEGEQRELQQILEYGKLVKELKGGAYTKNFNFFCNCIEKLKEEDSDRLTALVVYTLENCSLLPIEADTQSMALNIFATLNDRGLPLTDSDIFKAQLYRTYNERGEKEQFMQRWKRLEETLEDIRTYKHTPMDDLFTCYMYYTRAQDRIASTSRIGLRNYYEKNSYELLKKPDTIDKLDLLADFLKKVSLLDSRFEPSTQKLFYILLQAPNNLAQQLIAVYFLHKQQGGVLPPAQEIDPVLESLIACILLYTVLKPGGDYLSKPIYKKMVDIVHDIDRPFEVDIFTEEDLYLQYAKIISSPINKSFILTWYAFQTSEQCIIPTDLTMRTTYILPQEAFEGDKLRYEALGNQSLVEEYFRAKMKGNAANYLNTDGSLTELRSFLTQHPKPTPADIHSRNQKILEALLHYLRKYHLLG